METVKRALNHEITMAGETPAAPDWVRLMPPGPEIKGRDGRSWRMDDPASLVAAFNSDSRDIPLDFEHSTELQAPKGLPAPAAAWFKELKVDADGGISGRADWTQSGRNAVESKEYRYISPVFVFDRATGRVVRITSAALTNQPNLRLEALNHQQTHEQGEAVMKKVFEALGLPEGSDEDKALNAVSALKAKADGQAPSLDKYVPRPDFDAMTQRALNAEKLLKEGAQAQLDKEIDDEVAKALEAGKITPSTADYHRAMCRIDGGLDRFREFVKVAPEIAGVSGLDKKKPESSAGLSDEEKAVCRNLGISEEDYLKNVGSKG
ncbi:phage protease [Desulforegula conservatrix]|uniref:phage protease n=1 Tax=Desulforegula conservatrix TaxID=153026 RepID=UPI0004096A07|nr:phage protease [Desulforegula conservatrix]